MTKYYPKDEEKSTEAVQLNPNLLVDKRYLIKFEVRRDNATVVYLAYDRKMDKNVALAVIPKAVSEDEELIEALKKDVSDALELTHENVVRLYNVDSWKGLTFAVMEHVPGSTLAQYLKEKGGRIGLEEAIPLLRQIAVALDTAHGKTPPVSHLGLNAANMLMTDHGRVKVADFGLAKGMGKAEAAISGKAVAGLTACKAPEQLTGEKVGPWTDVYAFGAIAYEMIAGQAPFALGNMEQQILHADPPTIEGIPEHVNQALACALQKEGARRPASAGDFVAMLAGEKPVPKIKKGLFSSRKKGGGKAKGGLAAAVVFFLVLAFAGGLGWFLLYDETPNQPVGGKIDPPVMNGKAVRVPSIEAAAGGADPSAASRRPVEPPTGELMVSSRPPGADILLNGEKKGATPLTIEGLQAGRYTLSIRKKDFAVWEEPVEIEALKLSEISVDLKTTYGSIAIESQPEGAEVFVGGRKAGETPLTIDRAETGARQIEVRKEGYTSWKQGIKVAAGEKVKLIADLKTARGNLNVSSQPPDADVFVDGKKQGATPLVFSVLPGMREVEIRKDGYVAWRKNVNVAAGGEIDLAAQLKTATGGLNVSSKPTKAEVYIDGKPRGQTPLVLSNISAGQVKIVVKKNCYREEGKTISIREGRTEKVRFSLKSECGELSVKSVPEGAGWYLDDQYQGVTPETVQDVKEGDHIVRITKEKYIDWVGKIHIRPGQRLPVTANLDKALPNPGDTYRDPATGMDFVWVHQGCYLMGSEADEVGRDSDEGPRHEVCVEGFWMGKYEVTQAQWGRVMGANPSFFNKGGSYPVDSVSWKEVQGFIQKLNAMSAPGIRYRLPSEAEWEYACRSGGKDDIYSGGIRDRALAWHKGNSKRTTHPVGEKAPNRIGLYDMSGNLYEWVEDAYLEDAYKQHRQQNPVVDAGGSASRVIRGGSWKQGDEECRCAGRNNSAMDSSNYEMGFRLVRNP